MSCILLILDKYIILLRLELDMLMHAMPIRGKGIILLCTCLCIDRNHIETCLCTQKREKDATMTCMCVCAYVCMCKFKRARTWVRLVQCAFAYAPFRTLMFQCVSGHLLASAYPRMGRSAPV